MRNICANLIVCGITIVLGICGSVNADEQNIEDAVMQQADPAYEQQADPVVEEATQCTAKQMTACAAGQKDACTQGPKTEGLIEVVPDTATAVLNKATALLSGKLEFTMAGGKDKYRDDYTFDPQGRRIPRATLKKYDSGVR